MVDVIFKTKLKLELELSHCKAYLLNFAIFQVNYVQIFQLHLLRLLPLVAMMHENFKNVVSVSTFATSWYYLL